MRNVLITLFCVLLLSTPVPAQTLASSAWGRVQFGGNELMVDSTLDDPSALRLGAPVTQRGLGKISFDIVTGDHRHEVVLVQGKHTEDGLKGGEFYLGLARPGGATADADMIDALVATVQDGFQFRLPIFAPNLQMGQGTVVVGNWFIQSANGKCRTYMQDDGNLVSYEVMPGNWLRPYWSIYTGTIDRGCGQ